MDAKKFKTELTKGLVKKYWEGGSFNFQLPMRVGHLHTFKHNRQ